MPIPLFNSVASWFLKKRINQIELFKKYPNEVQQEVLRKLLVYNIIILNLERNMILKVLRIIKILVID